MSKENFFVNRQIPEQQIPEQFDDIVDELLQLEMQSYATLNGFGWGNSSPFDIKSNNTPTKPKEIATSQQLFEAIKNSKEDILGKIRKFITSETVNSFNEEGWTPLHLVLLKGHIYQAKLLKDSGADLDAISKNSKACTVSDIINEQTLLHKAATANGTIAGTLKTLKDLGADFNMFNEDGWTPLHLLLNKIESDPSPAELSRVEILVSHGSRNDIVSNNSAQQTAVSIINEGILLNYLELRSIDKPPIEATKLLNLGGDLNYVNKDGWPLLHLAIKEDDNFSEIDRKINFLSEIGVVDQRSQNSEAKTFGEIFIEKICLNKNFSISDEFFFLAIAKKLKIDINGSNANGLSPLDMAIESKNLGFAQLLIKCGAANNLISDESTLIDHNSSFNKETVILFLGPNMEHNIYRDALLNIDPKDNLFHPDLLKGYFDVVEFTNFERMLSFVRHSQPDLPKVNIILYSHGSVNDQYHMSYYQLEVHKLNRHSTCSPAKSVLNDLIDASGGKPINLLTTACYGANLHTCDDDLRTKMPKGSKIITLSKEDRATYMVDTYNPDMKNLIEALTLNSKEGFLKLEDLLEVYCLSQRYLKNTPTISTFDGQNQIIIKLNDYFNNNILTSNKLSISDKLKNMLEVKSISPEYIDKLVQCLQNSEDLKVRNDLFEIPESISNIKILFDHLGRNNFNELFKLYSNYFVENHLDTVFDPNNFLPHPELEKSYKDSALFDRNKYAKSFQQHVTPLVFKNDNLKHHASQDYYDSTKHVILKNSLLLALAADQLFTDLDVNIIGDHLENC